MATVVDLRLQPIGKGDRIVLKNVEAYDFLIQDMGDLTIQQMPGQPAGVRVIRLITEITLTAPYIPGQAVCIPVYLVQKAEPPKEPIPEKSLQ